MARKHTELDPKGENQVSEAPESETKNLGGRPRKVRAALTPAAFEDFRTFLLGMVDSAHPEQVPDDLEEVPEQYREIILQNANSARVEAIRKAEEIIGTFA